MSGIHTIEEAQAYSDSSGYSLSDRAERILKALVKTGGKCPCVAVNAPDCPCPSHKEDIAENGKCHCGLFIKKGE